MLFIQWKKKITELKLVKIRQKPNLPAKLKINKHKYTVTKSCPEKICYFENWWKSLTMIRHNSNSFDKIEERGVDKLRNAKEKII